MSDLETLIRQSLRGQAERAPSAKNVEQAVLKVAGASATGAPLKVKRPSTSRWLPVLSIAVVVALILAGATTLFRGDDSPPAPSATSGESIPVSTSDWRPGDPGAAAAIEGVLRVTESGCLYLETPWPGNARSDIVWPADWTARRHADGSAQLLDDNGRPVAQTGQYIASGGGEIPEPGNLVCEASTDGEAFTIMSEVAVVDDDHPTEPIPSAQPASWRLAPGEALDPAATTLSILVTEEECASGQSALGRILPPEILYSETSIEIRVYITPMQGADCPSNPETPFTVVLDQPLGDRELVNGNARGN